MRSGSGIRRALLLVVVAGLTLGLVGPAAAPPAQLSSAAATSSVTITTTTETVLATLPGINTYIGGAVRVECITSITAGTGTTAITVRLRRGTGITGTLVGNANAITVTAGNTVDIIQAGEDTPGEAASLQYVCTAQQTAASANGTALQTELLAFTF